MPKQSRCRAPPALAHPRASRPEGRETSASELGPLPFTRRHRPSAGAPGGPPQGCPPAGDFRGRLQGRPQPRGVPTPSASAVAKEWLSVASSRACADWTGQCQRGASRQLSTFPHHPLLQGRHFSPAGAAPDPPPSPRPTPPPSSPAQSPLPTWPLLQGAPLPSPQIALRPAAYSSLLPSSTCTCVPLHTHPTPPGPQSCPSLTPVSLTPPISFPGLRAETPL